MRVTNRMTSRNYLRTLNNNLSKLAETEERIGSHMKFQNLSDNVIDGARAMRIGQQLDKTERHLQNVSNVRGELEYAENVLNDVEDILVEVHTKVIKALEQSKDQDENVGKTAREAVAAEISNLKGQVLQYCNGKFSDKYVFSGTQNYTAPFTLNQSGKVLFNGIPVDSIYEKDGSFCYETVENGVTTEKIVPQSEEMYIDVGLGIKMTAGNLDPATTFQVSFSGLDILGFGTTPGKDGTAMQNNVFSLLDQMETALRNADTELAGELNDHLSQRRNEVYANATDMGNRTNFLDRTESRLTDEKNTLEKMCSSLMAIDEGEEAINLSTHKRILQATLSYGSQIIPMSLIDFIR